jgi:hypothetical protein
MGIRSHAKETVHHNVVLVTLIAEITGFYMEDGGKRVLAKLW